jgi:hypothetical protein
MKILAASLCALTLLAPGASALDLGVHVLGVGVGAHVDKHGVGAGGHIGHVVGTGASVGDRGVHTGAHVASVGAGGGLDRHGVGAGAHVASVGAGANVGGHCHQRDDHGRCY